MNTLYFHLVMLNDDYVSDDIIFELLDINPTIFDCEDEVITLQNGGFEELWLTYDDDLIELSKRYPDDVFVLNYEGEGTYKNYYKNGKMDSTTGEIVFPEYDETKLIEKNIK